MEYNLIWASSMCRRVTIIVLKNEQLEEQRATLKQQLERQIDVDKATLQHSTALADSERKQLAVERERLQREQHALIETVATGAKRLAGGGQVSSGGDSGGDLVDLSAEMVALMLAKNASGANLKAVEVANEMASQSIDVLG